MCGLAGFIGTLGSDCSEVLRRMTDAIAHRGPDAQGFWIDSQAGVALGHRRLSIVELSELGAQPMHSASGRYTIVYNGEVYNYRRLRSELTQLGHHFAGGSDTEVVLAAIEQWGLVDAVGKFIGMFAAALWDAREGQLHLIRDRFGKKPLYYGRVGRDFVFASELKSIRRYPGFEWEIDREALVQLLRYGYVPSPLSIHRSLRKVRPGSIVTFNARGNGAVTEHSYWAPRRAAAAARTRPFSGTFDDAKQELSRLLTDSVELRMISDVPLGAFLSGGIDSSLVVALMQKLSEQPVRTFSIGFVERAYNEANYAKAVADHIGTSHEELYVTPAEAMSVIPGLPEMYDEPMSDVSQIPTYLVSRLARKSVTVALSGDGGDESFGGYQRYLWLRTIWQTVERVPPAIRGPLFKGIQKIPAPFLNWVGDVAQVFRSPGRRVQLVGDKAHKLSAAAAVNSPVAVYERLITLWTEAHRVVRDAPANVPLLSQDAEYGDLEHVTREAMLIDATFYLPDDVLVKVDRASMAVSLEARAPLLDHRLFEFSASLPLEFKVQGTTGKRILRELLYELVPRTLVDRSKTGFGVPIDQWLRGPLREWAEDLLSPARLRADGYFDPQVVQRMWNEHVSVRRQWHYHLWVILTFNAWLSQINRPPMGAP
jgi:asparagine synthase (glutamine-hydrolysing)